MASVMQSLWPADIRPTVVSPYSILDLQAKALAEQTKGLLVGQLSVSSDEEKQRTYVNLDIVAPVLDNSRHRILTASFRTGLIYPVVIDADRFHAKIQPYPGGKPENEATTDKGFMELVGKVLQSDEVIALSLSLIARSNDILKEREGQASESTS